MVDDDDVVGQQVGLLEVLRREQHAWHPTTDQVADDAPHLLAAADVEPRGRLVEDQHRRRGDQGAGEVEAAAHAAGVGLGRSVAGVGQVEPLEQLAGPLEDLARPSP